MIVTSRALSDGDFVLVNETDHNVLSYLRWTDHGTAVLIALNLSPAYPELQPETPGAARQTGVDPAQVVRESRPVGRFEQRRAAGVRLLDRPDSVGE
jgi:hypothetical protein